GAMQVIPLLSELEDYRFVSPSQAKISTSEYGTMVFENPTSELLLIPSHTSLITPQKAQDHAMATAGIAISKQRRRFQTAACIQESQGGFIREDEDHRFIILPPPLREAALKTAFQEDYNKLWPSIRKFNKSMGVKERSAHLEYFFDAYAEEIDYFVAQFEPVHQQVGAIILSHGQVVGIERSPSTIYWLDLWPALIRGCYGSFSLYLEKQISKKDRRKIPDHRIPLKCEGDSLDDLLTALEETQAQENEKAKKVVRQLLELSMQKKRREDDRMDVFSIERVESDRFLGQMVSEKGEDGAAIYASLFIRNAWVKNRRWRQAEPFSI
ncbi:ARPP-1 family domain-containing protein, partial [Magnetococcales bacterium HHB-1]